MVIIIVIIRLLILPLGEKVDLLLPVATVAFDLLLSRSVVSDSL